MLKFLFVFIFLAIGHALSISLFQIEFGTVSYWSRHGIFLLIFLALFPRLTLLFSSIPFGGFFWWFGLFFFPRYLIAAIATLEYWQCNPILVTLAWLVAIGGETTEKMYVNRRVVLVHKNRSSVNPNRYRGSNKDDDVIDAEIVDS